MRRGSEGTGREGDREERFEGREGGRERWREGAGGREGREWEMNEGGRVVGRREGGREGGRKGVGSE